MRGRFRPLHPLLLLSALLAPAAGFQGLGGEAAALQAAQPGSGGFGEEGPLPAAPRNLDFEEGELGKTPPGWTVPAAAQAQGFGAEVSAEEPARGKRCALLRTVVERRAPTTGALVQDFDAAAYRGRRVRFRAAVRIVGYGPSSQARLVLAVERPGGAPGFVDRMDDRPISALQSRGWRTYELTGDVANDAVSIEIGLLLKGDGKAWIDAASFTVLGLAGAGDAPARPLTARGLENLVALTRLLGYVRYFHPSDQAAATDWPALAAAAVAAAEPAADSRALAAALERLFHPIAPTLRVYLTEDPTHSAGAAAPEGSDPPLPPAGETPAPVVLAWRYEGFGTGGGGPAEYGRRLRSEQAREPTPDLPDPRVPFVADLGDGISCSLPLALYADSAGTLPHEPPQSRGSDQPAAPARPLQPAHLPPIPGPERRDKEAAFVPSGNDRTTRLVDVALAWNAIQHFYPEFDGLRDLWPQALREALGQAAADDGEIAFLHTLRRLVAKLGDGQGRAVLAGDLRVFEPPLRWDWVEGRLVVTQVGAGAPPELKPGAVVVKVAGRDAAAALAAAEEEVSAATPQWRRQRALAELAQGARDEPLRLEIQPAPGAPARTLSLPRTVAPIGAGAAFDQPEAVREPVPGVMVADLTRLDDRALSAALPRLARARAIGFDLRGYPRVTPLLFSHLVTAPVASAPLLAPVVTRPDHLGLGHSERRWSVEPRPPHLGARLVFLANARAISRAESYLDLVARERLGTIVGSPTAGTNGDVASLRLPGGYTLLWTGIESRRSDGTLLRGRGIQPEILAEPVLAEVAAGRDAVLERALAIAAKEPA